jgi:excisionase family DNA binding protein
VNDQIRHFENVPYTVQEAARRLNCSDDSVRRRIAAGELRAVRVGRLVRIEPKEVEKFIARGGSHD